MNDDFVCIACHKKTKSNPCLKTQQLYCSDSICQNARKAKWKRDKLSLDPLFKADHRDGCHQWRSDHPDYWRNYRRNNPIKTRRNRALQMVRDSVRKQRLRQSNLAKVDALKGNDSIALKNESIYWLVPLLAKVDTLKVKLTMVSDGSVDLAKVDAIDRAPKSV